MRRYMPAALGLIFMAVPLFPSFITFTGVAFPGVSLLPVWAILAVFAGCCILAVYALAMLVRYPAAGAQPLLAPLLTVFGAGLLAGCLGFDPRSGLVFTFIGGLGIVWSSSILRFYGDRFAATLTFGSFLLSGGIAAAIAIAMVVLRSPVNLYALQHGRATGTFILPGELAGYLIVLLPMAYAVGCVAHSRVLRSIAWSALAVGLVALALTFSRAGWMGCAAAAAFLVAVQTRRPAVSAAVIAAGVCVVAILFNAHHDPSEDYTRLSIWQAAIQIVDRFPLLGVGPFNFSRLYPLVRSPDGDLTAFHAHSLLPDVFRGVRHRRCLRGRLDDLAIRRRAAVAFGECLPVRSTARLRRSSGTGRRCRARPDRYGERGNFRAVDAHDGPGDRGRAGHRRPGARMMRRAAPVALAVLWALGGCNPQPGKTVATPSPSARPRSGATPLRSSSPERGPKNGRFTSFSKSTTASTTICWQAHTRVGARRTICVPSSATHG